MSPEFVQQISQLPQGNYKIIVHETQNSSGQDASYEGQLVQQRGQAVQQILNGNGSQSVITRGDNVVGSSAFVEIVNM